MVLVVETATWLRSGASGLEREWAQSSEPILVPQSPLVVWGIRSALPLSGGYIPQIRGIYPGDLGDTGRAWGMERTRLGEIRDVLGGYTGRAWGKYGTYLGDIRARPEPSVKAEQAASPH